MPCPRQAQVHEGHVTKLEAGRLKPAVWLERSGHANPTAEDERNNCTVFPVLSPSTPFKVAASDTGQEKLLLNVMYQTGHQAKKPPSCIPLDRAEARFLNTLIILRGLTGNMAEDWPQPSRVFLKGGYPEKHTLLVQCLWRG